MYKEQIKEAKKEFISAFGKHVRKLRKQAGLTQDELGRRCFADARKIGSVERGEYDFSFSSLYIIANGLGLAPKELFCFEYSRNYIETISNIGKK